MAGPKGAGRGSLGVRSPQEAPATTRWTAATVGLLGGHVESDLTLLSRAIRRLIRTRTERDVEFLHRGALNAYGLGGSLMLDYERYRENYEIDVELRFTNIRLLGQEIMGRWRERGYVREVAFVEADAFSDAAGLRLTISGSQHNTASFGMELLNALTLMLWPYAVTHEYDLRYTLEDVATGRRFAAALTASDTTWVELFLLIGLPFARCDHLNLMERVADDLYEQFRQQGAFEAEPPPVTGE